MGEETTKAKDIEKIDIGTCRFCGQSAHVLHCFTQEQANQRATLSCDCYQGKEYRNAYEREQELKRTIDAAKQNAAALFPNNTDVSDILCGVIEPIARQKIDAVTFKIDDQVKVNIKGSGAKITIQKVTTLEELEST